MANRYTLNLALDLRANVLPLSLREKLELYKIMFKNSRMSPLKLMICSSLFEFMLMSFAWSHSPIDLSHIFQFYFFIYLTICLTIYVAVTIIHNGLVSTNDSCI